MPGRIISPTPIIITIEYSEVTNQAQARMTKDMPLPILVQVFCQVLSMFAGNAWRDFLTNSGLAPGQQPPGGEGGGPNGNTQ